MLGVILLVSTFILGLICSVITAIISALFLCEIANTLPLERKDKINYVVLLALPLVWVQCSRHSVSLVHYRHHQAAGCTLHAGFWYLMDQLGILIILVSWAVLSSLCST